MTGFWMDRKSNVYKTNPKDSDTDDDELEDGLEVTYGTDPLDADTDNDGLPDGQDVDFLKNAVNGLPLDCVQTSWRWYTESDRRAIGYDRIPPPGRESRAGNQTPDDPSRASVRLRNRARHGRLDRHVS